MYYSKKQKLATMDGQAAVTPCKKAYIDVSNVSDLVFKMMLQMGHYKADISRFKSTMLFKLPLIRGKSPPPVLEELQKALPAFTFSRHTSIEDFHKACQLSCVELEFLQCIQAPSTFAINQTADVVRLRATLSQDQRKMALVGTMALPQVYIRKLLAGMEYKFPWSVTELQSTVPDTTICTFRWPPGVLGRDDTETFISAVRDIVDFPKVDRVRFRFADRVQFSLELPGSSASASLRARELNLVLVTVFFESNGASNGEFKWDTEFAMQMMKLERAALLDGNPQGIDQMLKLAHDVIQTNKTILTSTPPALQALQLCLRDAITALPLPLRRQRVDATSGHVSPFELSMVMKLLPSALLEVAQVVCQVGTIFHSCHVVHREAASGYYDTRPKSRAAQVAYVEAESAKSYVMIWSVSVVAAFEDSSAIFISADLFPNFRYYLAYPRSEEENELLLPEGSGKHVEEFYRDQKEHQTRRRNCYIERVYRLESSGYALELLELRLSRIVESVVQRMSHSFPTKTELLQDIFQLGTKPAVGIASFHGEEILEDDLNE